MHVRQKIAVAVVGGLALGGIGAGTALARANTTTEPTAPAVSAPSPTRAPDTAGTPDTDAVQQGDQTTPDVPGTEAPERPGVEHEKAEKPGVEEPGDAQLPGGGHADSPGHTVDNQFEGVQ